MNRTEEAPSRLKAVGQELAGETALKIPNGACIHQVIEQKASEIPDAIAVVCRDEQLTYRELNARANQVASYLSKVGVGPEKLVGICVERSLEMVICLLGILKSGGAYLPLDPDYPAERLAFMLQDAGVEVLVCQNDLISPPPEGRMKCERLETCLPMIRGEPNANLERGVAASNLAYVIYTSGSTGKPKGVMIEHRNVTSFFEAMNARVPHGPGCAWLAVTSPSFDISVLELLWTLSRGFKVVLYAGDESNPAGGTQDYSMPALIERHDVTHLQCTPSMASMLLLDKRTREALGRLSVLLIGGETFPVTLAQQLGEVVKGAILNMYGPTETTVWSTTYQVPHGISVSRIPVGRPIANTETYIVKGALEAAPTGVGGWRSNGKWQIADGKEAGELLIGGAGVARGYLGRDEVTAERFIANPFPGGGAPRLYRTGDLARYLPDGNIELLGRMDQQVKIRGHRVELGEIEFVLNQHPDVRESVVLLRDMGSDEDKALAAYIIASAGQKPTREQLRQHMAEKLPDYMTPAHYVLMTAFPQTPNRKINRNAFPPPETELPQGEDEPEQPLTGIEQTLAAIWKELLRMQRVRRHDNFFEVGGHSMLAMQLVARVQKRFNVDLTLKNVFERQTLAGMAEVIEALSWSQVAKSQPTGEREVVDV